MATVVYFVKDLLFSSKIRGVAGQLGLTVEPARDVDALAAAAKDAKLVIFDLRLPDALAAIDRLKSDEATRHVQTVAFIDHEKIELMDEASKRGVNKVLAKGGFSTMLPSLLADLA